MMEGTSGDGWISVVKSMRSHSRGSTVSGMMADFVRRKGFSKRSQFNHDRQVLQIPLILWAGLGELSRIGELVLSPLCWPAFQVGLA